MALVNVNRENPDQFYRYKMPLIIAKVEGKGNGIKTVIVNMVEVAKALSRPPSYPCKYFGCELGAQTQMDPKMGRFIVNGSHESAKLQDMLDGFIKKFVLCTECDNPETDLHVQASKGKIQQGCRACGYRNLIDTRHKLSTFIIKNPPNATEDTSSKKDKKGRRKEKGGKKGDKKHDSPTHTTGDGASAENGDNDFLDDQQPIQNGDGSTGDDDDWGDEVSEAAVACRMEHLSGHVTSLTLTTDMEKSVGDRVDSFYKLVEGFKKSGIVGAKVTTLKAEAERLDLMDKAAGILGELLFTENILAEIKDYRVTFLHFVLDNRKGQKYLLISVERLVGEVFPSLLPKVAIILKSFYDNDILEEESIFEWADKVPKKHVNSELGKTIREKAAPFVTWLRTAEEESSEDEEVEVVYSESTTGGSLLVQEKQPQQVTATGIDIDAI